MKNANKKAAIIIVAISAIVIVFAVLSLYWGYVFSLFYPSTPEIRYGEFPFTLTYELNGETKVINDVIVCEFDGFTFNGAEIYREWKTTVKSSGREDVLLLNLRDANETDDFGYTVQELYFYCGNATYYMGDDNIVIARDEQDLNKICYAYQTADGRIGKSAFKSDVALEKYGIKLISWECAPPIENRFIGE